MTARLSSMWNLNEPIAIPWAGLKTGIVESSTEVALLELGEWKPDVKRYERGLLFGPKCELRWLKRESGWHFVYLHDDGSILTGSQANQEVIFEDEDQIILWGEKEADAETYYDGRIPHILIYPRPASGNWPTRMAAGIRRYRFGDREIFRCFEIREAR